MVTVKGPKRGHDINISDIGNSFCTYFISTLAGDDKKVEAYLHVNKVFVLNFISLCKYCLNLKTRVQLTVI